MSAERQLKTLAGYSDHHLRGEREMDCCWLLTEVEVNTQTQLVIFASGSYLLRRRLYWHIILGSKLAGAARLSRR